MSAFFSFVQRRSLLLSQVLCTVIVFWVARPVLQSPRIEGDDYRYLHGIQQCLDGTPENLSKAALVENRWDHLWFLEEEGRVRFFRPTVAASYGLDWMIWGERYAFGLSLTNVLLHLGCSLLVAFLLHRWIGPGAPAIFSSMLFAGLWAHAECIWYIAGRTDSLAALGFLAAFSLHIAKRPALRWWAIPCFAMGLITKELVVAAPLLFLAYDLLVERKRPQWTLYAAYVVAAIMVLLLKHLAMGGVSSDFVYPYLLSPLQPEFSEHLWLQARSYSANLLLTQWTAPFGDRATVAAMSSLAGVAGALLLLIGAGILLRRDGRFWFLLLLGAATWLPTSFVYLSERYLYLPSLAFVGILGLLISTRPPRLRNLLTITLGFYAVFQSARLYEKHRDLCEYPGSVNEMMTQLKPVRGEIVKGGNVLLVNVPGDFLRAQFAQETFRVVLGDPELAVEVLTLMPGQNGTVMRSGDSPPAMGASPLLKRVGENKLLIQGQPQQRVQEYNRFPFSWALLDAGLEYATPELVARIIESDTVGATAIEFTLHEPLERYQILIWDAHPDYTMHPWSRRAFARVRVVTF